MDELWDRKRWANNNLYEKKDMNKAITRFYRQLYHDSNEFPKLGTATWKGTGEKRTRNSTPVK